MPDLPSDTTGVTVMSARVLTTLLPSEQEVTLSAARVLTSIQPSPVQVTSISARRIIYISPDYRWIDMFSDLVFPHDISEGSDGATRFNTLVNEVASGHDQRIALWDHPLMEYNVSYGVRTMEQLHDLIRFFRVMRGRLTAFRFYDNVDHTSTFAETEEARAAPDPGPFDQQIGIGDSFTSAFQLVKNYTYADQVSVRPILKPVPDTVLMAVDGNQIENFTVDTNLGIVTVVPRINGVTVPHCAIAKVTPGDPSDHLWQVTVPAYAPGPPAVNDPLPIFNPDEWVVIAGGPTPITDVNVVGAGTHNAVQASSATVLTFIWPGQPGDHTTAESADCTLIFTSNSVPRTGQAVTAGYEFHVPVRFDVDKIPVKLEYYGVGSAEQITRVEVRPEDAV